MWGAARLLLFLSEFEAFGLPKVYDLSDFVRTSYNFVHRTRALSMAVRTMYAHPIRAYNVVHRTGPEM